jgi:hypothetical protein
MRTTWKALTTILAVLAVSTSGCTDDNSFWSGDRTGDKNFEGGLSDDGSSASSSTGSKAGQTDEVAQTLDDLRDVDPCSLLDREAIKKVTQVDVGVHVPGSELSSCRVDTEVDDLELGWSFGVDVGLLYKPADHVKKETIADQEYFIEGRGSTSCAAIHMITEDVGVSLTAIAPPSDSPDDPCEVAKTYLTEAGPSFTVMGKRNQQLTKPQLPLADRDPCEAGPQIGETFDTKVISLPLRPFLCSIQPDESTGDSPLAEQDLSIAYEFKTDPRDNLPHNPQKPGGGDLGTTSAVVVAGHPGTQFDGAGKLGCSIDLVVDDQITLDVGSLKMVQVMSAYATDCDIAKQAAQAAITKIGASN